MAAWVKPWKPTNWTTWPALPTNWLVQIGFKFHDTLSERRGPWDLASPLALAKFKYHLTIPFRILGIVLKYGSPKSDGWLSASPFKTAIVWVSPFRHTHSKTGKDYCSSKSKVRTGYGSIPIDTIFSGMNIHLPAILMFTRGTRFWHTANSLAELYWLREVVYNPCLVKLVMHKIIGFTTVLHLIGLPFRFLEWPYWISEFIWLVSHFLLLKYLGSLCENRVYTDNHGSLHGSMMINWLTNGFKVFLPYFRTYPVQSSLMVPRENMISWEPTPSGNSTRVRPNFTTNQFFWTLGSSLP